MTTAKVLIVFHSSEGQTAKIADRLADTLRNAGIEVDIELAEHAPAPTTYDGVVLGDSIHQGHHSRALERYIAHHADELAGQPVALFQVSLTSANDDAEHSATAHAMVHRLLDDTGLDPDMVGLFAGALAYTRYGWLKRRIMRRVVAAEGGDTDTSTDHEYTDWDAVAEFATDFAGLLASRVR